MKLLTLDEQRMLRHRNKENDLYRQWSPILAMLQRDSEEADAQTLWHVAEQQIARLRSEQMFREQEIPPIYNELLSESLIFNEKKRNKQQARRTASTVMCIMLTMLINAVLKGHEEEPFENEPMCMAIQDILKDDDFSQKLMELFFKRKIGYDGRKVVIAPNDPMKTENNPESMDEIARKEITEMVKDVMRRTAGLKTLFGDHWSVWEQLWNDICADTELMMLLKKQEPRGNDWGINLKMVCNVTGMFKEQLVGTNVSVKAINNVLYSKNIRSYISSPADFDGSDSAFNRSQYDKVKRLIEKSILSMADN